MSRQQKVLVIDDSQDIHRLVRVRLRDFQVELLFAVDAHAGIQMAIEHTPDLILLDIEMPTLDGFEACERLKDDVRTRDIPIIFLTASDDPEAKVRGFKLGAVDYITKPFNGDELRSRANAALRTRALIDMLNTQAHTDALTGLANRLGFINEMRRSVGELATPPEHGDRGFAVVFLDLDRFKMVNDGLGHEVGDALLVHVASVLCEAVRSVVGTGIRPHRDVVARIGGDEFTVLLSAVDTPEQAEAVAQRILAELSEPITIGAQEVTIGASIGIRFCDRFAGTAQEILRDADLAMYEAKSAGKGQYKLFDGPMHDRLARRLKLERDLRHALQRDELSLVYQPLVDLASEQVSGYEVLTRWQHPELGEITPTEFITIAEDAGLITELGAWVLERAATQLKRWQTLPHMSRSLQMSVNVSKRQLADRQFIQRVKRLLHDTGLPAGTLQLEVTESNVMIDAASMVGVLNDLRALGVRLAMDDFGTGVSSLSLLHRMPFDVLKIDRSFVRCINHSKAYAAIIQAVTMLAQNLGMTVIAEGVETAEQAQVLLSLGCDVVQGFYYAKPLPPDEAEKWSAQWHRAHRGKLAG